MELEKPYSIRDLTGIDHVPEGNKRCRICKEVKNLDEFRMIYGKGKSWPYYACKPCSREIQRRAYLRRKQQL